MKPSKKEEKKQKKEEKKQKKDQPKRLKIVEAQSEEKYQQGITFLPTPLAEKDVLFTIKMIFVGDPCTLEERKKLMWGYYKSHTEPVPANLQTTNKDVKIDGFAGRISTILYDNNVSNYIL